MNIPTAPGSFEYHFGKFSSPLPPAPFHLRGRENRDIAKGDCTIVSKNYYASPLITPDFPGCPREPGKAGVSYEEGVTITASGCNGSACL